jgi:hypothetical protein
MTASDAQALLIAGRSDGTWNGASGFITRSASPDTGMGLGYLLNDDGSITVGYAAAGDINLDAAVDILDVSALLTGVSLNTVVSRGWGEGDFDYNGLFDILDIGAFLGTDLYEEGPYL